MKQELSSNLAYAIALLQGRDQCSNAQPPQWPPGLLFLDADATANPRSSETWCRRSNYLKPEAFASGFSNQSTRDFSSTPEEDTASDSTEAENSSTSARFPTNEDFSLFSEDVSDIPMPFASDRVQLRL
jgi:hypothetical protein